MFGIAQPSLLVLAATLSSSVAFLSLAPCKQVSGIDNFNVTSYLGVWYEYSNMFEIFEIGGKCIRANYTEREDGKIGVKNEQVNEWFGNYVSVSGTATPADPSNPNKAELIVSFTDFATSFAAKIGQNGRANYIVADTDYSTYSLVYSCTQIWFTSKESLWILTRDQKPEQSIVDTAYQKARDLGLPVDSLAKTNQDGCNALPTQ